MFEYMTFEVILNRMLRNSQKFAPQVDIRPSSPLYAAVAPAAVEVQNMYIEMDYFLNQFFSDTQNRENLIKRCKDEGIIPYPATKAILKGEFNIDVGIGERFSLGTLNYSVLEKISNRVYRMECETPGTIGNQNLGTVIPINYVPGLTHAELTEILEEGTDEEETEHLRERYNTAVQKPSTSGNKYDYENWSMECAGVGAVRVFPLAYGPNTVKVVITNANRTAAGEELLHKVFEHIEEMRPIGANVTVLSAIEKTISIKAKVKLQNGINLGAVQALFADQVEIFLKDYALRTDYISLARIGNLLINTEGVEDYKDLLLNEISENVQIKDTETPVIGSVVLEVM